MPSTEKLMNNFKGIFIHKNNVLKFIKAMKFNGKLICIS